MITFKTKFIILYSLVICGICFFLFYHFDWDLWQYFLSSRLLRLAAMMITATAIAVATITFQTITENKILTPSIIGLDWLYILIQTTIIFFFGEYGGSLSNLTQFAISILIMVLGCQLLFFICFIKNSYSLTLLILIGIVFGTLMRTTSIFLMRMLQPNEQQALESRIYASFHIVDPKVLIISIIILLVNIILLWRKSAKLDILLLGKDSAISLGVNYTKELFTCLTYCSILVAISTSMVGPITFLGLLVANLTYVIANTWQHKYMIPFSIGLSIFILLLGQVILEHIFALNNVITAIIDIMGCFMLIMILLKKTSYL